MNCQTKAIILARVSSRSQEEEGYSLDSQLKLMRQYCRSKKLDIVEEFKITETASKQQRRQIYQEMLRYVAKNKIFNLVVEKTDRLTRNFKDATLIDTWLEDNEYRMLHLVKENLLLHKNARSDTKFMWNIYLSFAKKYTDNLREEAMKGWDEKLAQGWLPAPPPVGYKTILECGKKIHVPDEAIAPLMEKVFNLATLPDYSIKRTMEAMEEMGIKTRKGRPYSKSHVHKILNNPFYIGINKFNGKEYLGAQEPIISKELFNKVQEKLKRPRYGRIRQHNPIFKGMIRCSSCDHLITWQLQKGRYYGACQRINEACKGKTLLREDRVEAQIIQKPEEIQDKDGNILKKLKNALEITNPHNTNQHRQRVINELQGRLDRIKRMEENLYDDRLANVISKQRYEEKREEFAEQIKKMAERLVVLQEAREKSELTKVEMKSDNPIVKLYLNSNPSQKRVVIATLFRCSTLQGNINVVQR